MFARKAYSILEKNLYPFSGQKGPKTIPFGAAHTYMAYIRGFSTPRPPGVLSKRTFFCIVDLFAKKPPTWNTTKRSLGSLNSDVLERRTSTGSGRFALLSRDFQQMFGQIVSIRIKTLGNTNMVASRLIKRGKGSLPVDVRRSKTSLLRGRPFNS